MLKNRYKININNNSNQYSIFRVNNTEKIFNTFLNLKLFSYFDKYYYYKNNKYVQFYLLNFYNIIIFKFFNKIILQLNLKNFYNFLIENENKNELLSNFKTMEELEENKLDFMSLDLMKDINVNLNHYKINFFKKVSFKGITNIYKKINNSIRALIKRKK